MHINWNIVDRTQQDHAAVAATLRPKIAKLEKLLTHFPEDAVHLQVILDARKGDKTYEVAFNLRVPSDVLHVSKESKNLASALDEGVNTLVRRLKRLKARYRKDYAWKHRRGETMPEKEIAFTELPMPADEGPQTHAAAIIEVLKQDYGRLLAFVTRQLDEHILSGSVPRAAVEPRDIVDRVAEEVLRHPGLKPDSMDYRTWCSSLAFQQTRKAVHRYAKQAASSIPLDLDAAPEPPPAGEDDLDPEEFALNLLQSQLEPDESTLADAIPDPQIEPPDREVGRSDVLSALRRVTRLWPNTDREVFELHFLEGLSVDDVAHTFECNRSTVEATVSRLRARLRTLLTELTGLRDVGEPSSEQKRAYAEHLHEVAGPHETG